VGKGRPTPKRSESQRRRTGPVAPPPQTRKEAAKRQKEAAAASRARVKDGAARGDDRYLSKRDAGPVRALVRDTVDARRNVGVLLLPLAVILVIAQAVSGATDEPGILDLALLIWLAGLLALAADLVLTALAIRKAVHEQFPEEGRTGRHISYGLLRSTVFRRLRLPAPRVRPGDARSA
jgi:hypothetical protein